MNSLCRLTFEKYSRSLCMCFLSLSFCFFVFFLGHKQIAEWKERRKRSCFFVVCCRFFSSFRVHHNRQVDPRSSPQFLHCGRIRPLPQRSRFPTWACWGPSVEASPLGSKGKCACGRQVEGPWSSCFESPVSPPGLLSFSRRDGSLPPGS